MLIQKELRKIIIKYLIECLITNMQQLLALICYSPLKKLMLIVCFLLKIPCILFSSLKLPFAYFPINLLTNLYRFNGVNSQHS